MNEKLLKAFQNQINAEMYSAYLYFSMSSWAEREALKGFAHWLRVQAQEEMFHATFMHDYLLRRGAPSLMAAIAEPPNEWAGVFEMMEHVCLHESHVTASINEIATIAMDCRDHAGYQFIMQYVDEQVEEEEHAGDIFNKIKFSQGKPEYLYALDQELAARVYTQPFGAPSQG